MVSACLPSDALSQCLPSYLGFSYLGRGESLHGCSSKAQPLLLTLYEVAPPDLGRGVDPDNHDGVITDLEPDILECEVKWALGSITTNKASGGDGIPGELFQILKDDAVKVLHSVCQQIWKTQHWPQDRKRWVFIPIPKKGSAKECSNYHTVALISHTSNLVYGDVITTGICSWKWEELTCKQIWALPRYLFSNHFSNKLPGQVMKFLYNKSSITEPFLKLVSSFIV